jgi:hypothetical protein
MSAQSLNAQPAERISTVPSVKITTSVTGGAPRAAIQSAASVGHRSSRMPIGLSSRTSRSHASMRRSSVRGASRVVSVGHGCGQNVSGIWRRIARGAVPASIACGVA